MATTRTPRTTRRAKTEVNPAADYIERWPHPGYDLLKRPDFLDEGPAWFTRCNAHGTLQPADNVKAADVQGTKVNRATWCAACRKAAK